MHLLVEYLVPSKKRHDTPSYVKVTIATADAETHSWMSDHPEKFAYVVNALREAIARVADEV